MHPHLTPFKITFLFLILRRRQIDANEDSANSLRLRVSVLNSGRQQSETSDFALRSWKRELL